MYIYILYYITVPCGMDTVSQQEVRNMHTNTLINDPPPHYGVQITHPQCHKPSTPQCHHRPDVHTKVQISCPPPYSLRSHVKTILTRKLHFLMTAISQRLLMRKTKRERETPQQ